MNLSEEDFYLLALHTVEGIGAIRANFLLNKFNNGKQLFEAKSKDIRLESQSIPKKIIDQIITKSTLQAAEEEIVFCEKNKIEILTMNSKDYPARLRVIDDKPLIIYKKGNIHPNIKRTIAIVGTRKSTEYGNKFLENLFQELKTVKDLAVISGLAHGIDYKAHALSMEHAIPTIAVMGLALNRIYPSANANLAKSILNHDGGWMTETSSKDKATQGVFPRRNRVIAGLGDALFVVETDIKGGSIISAHMANEYSKEVFALPGRISDPQSRGCNELIQKNLAHIVNSPADIIEHMNWSRMTNKNIPKVIEIDFAGSENQKKLLDIIRMYPKIELEQLGIKSKLSHSQLVEILLQLELDGWIHTLPGNKYELI